MIESTAAGLGLNEQQSNLNNIIKEQVDFVQKDDKTREMRPVENAEDSPEAKMNLQEETTTKTIIEDNHIIVERYNKEGELVNKIPPGFVPLSEMV